MIPVLFGLFIACGSPGPHDHDHGDGPHSHDHGDKGHDHGKAAKAEPKADKAEDAGASEVMEGKLGDHTARLARTAEGLRLVVHDADNKPVTPAGEARVVFTGTGEEEQRVVLSADGEAWTGAAKATGAKGYLAVISVEIGGAKQTARLTWGDVPEPKAAAEPHDHDHGDGAHAHEHGDHTHKH